METMREKAAQMLRESEVVVLTSVNEEGYPRPVPMSMVKSEDISTVWMSTGSDSMKTEDFRKNPKGGLCFHAQGNSVCMTGDVEVITDQNVKQELWQDWFINHFPGGPTDPNYVILKLTANHATYWIDGEFIHKKV
ncbi:pyridoxamine 5'-phosphate oxidase family protein [Bacteroides cellulosilyticus]|uniref:pyridoxamine 5'-phosphate oxidase family protein n=1 Tax=Bacteroides cellulosilyticus TaxID=246787 RepID=UPI001C37DFAA|nr:pyridoxamine 5'-phosphate oxidase family protein [Bacteroides cellulosilyticus]MBV3636420.1 pyridoxamine 5'-phosphate oxidase family protein [Bacteroides cellulosilyticus]MBV3662566.1 pyridoxamine 5'-phosphate oxidase family protein [Bacteroides cellulosilyticus]MBV3684718.1 pyridoxamine 5'-phosphate oxidase family protein [Bacteroides cellulosilyticus]MBV3693422.1 pyridoxamine 5'-phosphate oxidase family protein [Bacteroides cellulosilyticus]MBV3706878.1 pyridoxamine 5'-phosphate oxidase f